MAIASGLSLIFDKDFHEASEPLFAKGLVDTVEWSFDTAWGIDWTKYPWLQALIQQYSAKKELHGHGVRYSLLSANQEEYHQQWLDELAHELKQVSYQSISEHFGFMVTRTFSRSTPLPVPFSEAALSVAIENFLKLKGTVGELPLGLENLAFAFSKEDAFDQGLFISALLESIDGFLVLDLHNLYCQMFNFQIEAKDLLDKYPLHRVKQIHLSGGSLVKSRSQKVLRRDTHDSRVPPEVFAMLPSILPYCPNLQRVTLEQLGAGLRTPEQKLQFQKDYLALKGVLS